jgi:hypothetical protein
VQQTPASTPTAPTAPTAPYIVTLPQGGTPVTANQLRGYRERLRELRSQLQDAASRRSNVASQLRRADESARPGFEARLQILDSQIMQLQRDIAVTGQLITNAPPELLATTTPAFGRELAQNLDGIIPIVAILSIFVLGPFAIAMSRLIWKRASLPPRVAGADQATQQRLDALQQAVDTIAIEVERISEGQRFVTRLLSERAAPALDAGER